MFRTRRFPSLVVVSLLFVGTVPAQTDPKPDTAERLREELDQVTAFLDESKWKDAAARLARVLSGFEGSDAARFARTEIVDLDRRCRFGLQYQLPAPQSLIGGELLQYSPKTRRIRLRYTNHKLSDFETVRQTPFDSFHAHQALFSNYRVTIKGTSYSSTTILIGTNKGVTFQITVGEPPSMNFMRVTWTPTSMRRKVRSEPSKELVEKHWGADRPKKKKETVKRWMSRVRFPMKRGQPYKIELSVSSTRVSAKCNGRSLGSFKKERGQAGFGIRDHAFDTIEIEGTIEGSWMQNKFDAHRNAALTRFQKSDDPTRLLPRWLFAKPQRVETPTPASTGKRFPGTEAPKDGKYLAQMFKLLRAHDYQALLEALGPFNDRVPDTIQEFLRAQAYFGTRKYDEAINSALVCYEADPDFAPTAQLLGQIYMITGQHVKAVEYFDRCLQLAPTDAKNLTNIARYFALTGRYEKCRDVLRLAARAGIENIGLASTHKVLLKVKKGPNWSKRFTVESKHFRITSDIDEKVCRDASALLENGLGYFQQMLTKVNLPDHRFHVYIFSGRAGFDRYCKGIQLRVPVHTAGLYSPLLKQLLIWNLADRDQMLRTIRHEGFHQYMDLLLPGAPTWLNEGLAEYFEQSRSARGKPAAGMIQQRHLRELALLRPNSRPDLVKLLTLDHREFYLRPHLNYPTSWAFVHFLRHTTRANRKSFDRLIENLRDGVQQHVAIEALIGKRGPTALRIEFWRYVGELRAKQR